MSVPEFKLVFYKVIVCPFRGDQRGMVADLHDLTAVEHDDPVGVFDSRQAVGHDHNRPSFVKFIEVLHDLALVLRVEGVGDLIEELLLKID